jgi:hypothetical protein
MIFSLEKAKLLWKARESYIMNDIMKVLRSLWELLRVCEPPIEAQPATLARTLHRTSRSQAQPAEAAIGWFSCRARGGSVGNLMESDRNLGDFVVSSFRLLEGTGGKVSHARHAGPLSHSRSRRRGRSLSR